MDKEVIWGSYKRIRTIVLSYKENICISLKSKKAKNNQMYIQENTVMKK